jgi:hypothetical protein
MIRPAALIRRTAGILASGVVVATTGCGSPPPDAASLVQRTSAHMAALSGFHFHLDVSGYVSSAIPVQSADGDAAPPNLHAQVVLLENTVLLQCEVVVIGADVYLKCFTGGWTKLAPQQAADFFDVHALFDPQTGLFAAMKETTGLKTAGQQQSVNSHQTWPVTGRLSAARVHQLLSVARASGQDTVTYWIEPPETLWKAQLEGTIFDPSQKSILTFTFSNHDQPVTVTPPPLG